jgi:hypothetical protein
LALTARVAEKTLFFGLDIRGSQYQGSAVVGKCKGKTGNAMGAKLAQRSPWKDRRSE